jgi:hypothetical protein
LLKVVAERKALDQAYKDGALTEAEFNQKFLASVQQASAATEGTTSETNTTLLGMAAERKALAKAYEDGDLMATEFEKGLSAAFEQARAAAKEVDQKEMLASQRRVHSPLRLALYLVAAFAVGFFISPTIYPKIFGYRNAYECMLQHSSTYGATACMKIYPHSTDQ